MKYCIVCEENQNEIEGNVPVVEIFEPESICKLTMKQLADVITNTKYAKLFVIAYHKKFPENRKCSRCNYNRYKEKVELKEKNKPISIKEQELQNVINIMDEYSGEINVTEFIHILKMRYNYGFIKSFKLIKKLRSNGMLGVRQGRKNTKTIFRRK